MPGTNALANTVTASSIQRHLEIVRDISYAPVMGVMIRVCEDYAGMVNRRWPVRIDG